MAEADAYLRSRLKLLGRRDFENLPHCGKRQVGRFLIALAE